MKKLLLFASLFVLASCGGDYQTGKDIQMLENKIDSLQAKLIIHENFLINRDTITTKWRISIEKWKEGAIQAINANTEKTKTK